MKRKSALAWPDIDSGGWELMKQYLISHHDQLLCLGWDVLGTRLYGGGD
jgi:hypothetical protein